MWTVRGPISGPVIAASPIRLSVRATLSRSIGRTFFRPEANGFVDCSIYQVCQHAEMFFGGFGMNRNELFVEFVNDGAIVSIHAQERALRWLRKYDAKILNEQPAAGYPADGLFLRSRALAGDALR